MPYRRIEELPDSVKNSLPVQGQKEFLKIINSVLERIKDEGKAFQMAWGIMKNNGWKKVNGKWIKEEKKMSEDKEFYSVEKEIFKVGTWNGDEYTEEDLDNIVKAFYELKNKRDVPLKLGHDDKQRILQKEGLAAAGWVEELKKKGKKLVAKIVNIPKKIKELIEKKLYKNVSVELWWNYKDRETGKVYPKVLTGVALLGADIPAVGGLGEFQNFYSVDWTDKDDIRFYEYQEEREVKMAVWDTKYINDLPDSAFAIILPGGKKDEEGKTVPRALRKLPYKDHTGKIDLPHLRNALARLPQTDLTPEQRAKARAVLIKAAKQVGVGNYTEDEEKQLITEINEMVENYEKEERMMEKRLEELEKENQELKAKLEEMENEKKNLSEEKEKIENRIRELEEAKRKEEIKNFIAKMKEEGKIVPAIEKEVEILLEKATDDKVVKFKEGEEEKEFSQREVLERFISKLPKLADFKEYSENKEQEEIKTDNELPGTEKSKKLDAYVRKYMEEKKVDYKTALVEVSKEHPELVETEEEEK